MPDHFHFLIIVQLVDWRLPSFLPLVFLRLLIIAANCLEVGPLRLSAGIRAFLNVDQLILSWRLHRFALDVREPLQLFLAFLLIHGNHRLFDRALRSVGILRPRWLLLGLETSQAVREEAAEVCKGVLVGSGCRSGSSICHMQLAD